MLFFQRGAWGWACTRLTFTGRGGIIPSEYCSKVQGNVVLNPLGQSIYGTMHLHTRLRDFFFFFFPFPPPPVIPLPTFRTDQTKNDPACPLACLPSAGKHAKAKPHHNPTPVWNPEIAQPSSRTGGALDVLVHSPSLNS